MDKLKQFLDMLFDDSDRIFVADNLYTGTPLSKNEITSGQYFCLNACLGGRKRENLTKFRNFLIEIDEDPVTKQPISQREQVLLIHQKYKVPYSTVVNSGNKSVHFIISLEEPLDNFEEYELIANWIKNIVVEADTSVFVPEKLTRFIGGTNQKTGKEQKGFIPQRGRISNQLLLDWLNLYPKAKPDMKIINHQVTPTASNSSRDGVLQKISWYIQDYLKQPYNNVRGHYQCPVCASEGCDTSKDNMYVSGPEMKFHCFAVSEHNKLIFRELRSLYYKNKIK